MAIAQSHVQCTTRPASRLRWLTNLWAIRRQRAALLHLDADRLCDLGLTREQARDEATRPIWDVPDHWRR